jgi:hypothetical protein
VKHADTSDIPRILQMARAFHDAHGEGAFNAEVTQAFIQNALQSGCVLFSRGSFLIGYIIPDPGKGGALVAHEVFWWSEEGKGAEIREAFENWAKQHGASEVHISHPWGAKRVGGMLEKAGYEPATQVWRKVI